MIQQKTHKPFSTVASVCVMSLLFLFSNTMLFAATATPAPTAKATTDDTKPTATTSGKLTVTPTTKPEDPDLKKFKENVASKVSADMQKQRVTTGMITAISEGSVKIISDDDITFDVKIDETLTSIYQVVGTALKDLKVKDLKKAQYIIVTGLVIDKTVTANVIYIDEKFMVKSGKITALNKSDFTIDVITNEKEQLTLDVGSKTQQLILNIKTLETEKTGFSKVKEGDTIHFIVRKQGLDKTQKKFLAVQFVVVPQEYFQK